jgi:hypothetical protein
MRNFVLGLLLGWLATYAYLTQGEALQAAIGDLWDRASAPPATTPSTMPRRRY